MALFFSAARYMIGPFFNKMYMNDPIFLDSYVKGSTFLTSWYMHIFFTQRFFEAACSLGIQWIDCDICLTTSNKWVQKSKGSIWIRQHFGWSSIWMGPFFSDIWMGYSRFWNTGSYTRTTITHLPRAWTLYRNSCNGLEVKRGLKSNSVRSG